MPSKRRLVTSEICFVTEKAGLLDFSYNKCALGINRIVRTGVSACLVRQRFDLEIQLKISFNLLKKLKSLRFFIIGQYNILTVAS